MTTTEDGKLGLKCEYINNFLNKYKYYKSAILSEASGYYYQMNFCHTSQDIQKMYAIFWHFGLFPSANFKSQKKRKRGREREEERKKKERKPYEMFLLLLIP